jgi:hypothetical protein
MKLFKARRGTRILTRFMLRILDAPQVTTDWWQDQEEHDRLLGIETVKHELLRCLKNTVADIDGSPLPAGLGQQSSLTPSASNLSQLAIDFCPTSEHSCSDWIMHAVRVTEHESSMEFSLWYGTLGIVLSMVLANEFVLFNWDMLWRQTHGGDAWALRVWQCVFSSRFVVVVGATGVAWHDTYARFETFLRHKYEQVFSRFSVRDQSVEWQTFEHKVPIKFLWFMNR